MRYTCFRRFLLFTRNRGLFILFALILSACVKIGETGKSAFILTSPQQENQLGQDGYKEVLAKSKIDTDVKLNLILQRVGKRIAAQTKTQGYDWQFTLIESAEPNAWCMPGGKVAFYTGILPALKSEGGMAVVMGHEVAHATLRHSGQRITQQMIVAGGLQAAQISFANSQYDDLIMGMLGAGATVGVVLPYSRKHETEADIVGLKYMAKAGYDPQEAVRFWQRFGGGGSLLEEYLSTHPTGDKRVTDLQANMSEAMRLYNAAPKKYGLGENL